MAPEFTGTVRANAAQWTTPSRMRHGESAHSRIHHLPDDSITAQIEEAFSMDAISRAVMKPIKSITATEFEGRCNELIERVRRTRQPLLITRRGKPVAQLSPHVFRKARGKRARRIEPLNPLECGILYERDLVAPNDAQWDAVP